MSLTRAVPNRPMNPPDRRLGWLTLAALAMLLAWDATGGDLALARLAGTPLGFPLRDNGFLVQVMHEGAKDLSWLLVVALFAAIRWPVGLLRRLPAGARAQLALTVLLSVAAISAIKHASHTSCPWDLREFGGVAHHVSHWAWKVRDGGAGGCFPAGHASAAFAYAGGFFVLRRVSSRAAALWLGVPAGHASAAFAYAGGFFVLRRVSSRAAALWLGVSLAAGLALGLSQQLRGAHYMSHTLWTGWICWVVGFAVELLVSARAVRLPAAPAAMHAGS
jgi:membrane-associated PAP2 superfamily phosphatase